jgi:hypothetical protein
VVGAVEQVRRSDRAGWFDIDLQLVERRRLDPRVHECADVCRTGASARASTMHTATTATARGAPDANPDRPDPGSERGCRGRVAAGSALSDAPSEDPSPPAARGWGGDPSERSAEVADPGGGAPWVLVPYRDGVKRRHAVGRLRAGRLVRSNGRGDVRPYPAREPGTCATPTEPRSVDVSIALERDPGRALLHGFAGSEVASVTITSPEGQSVTARPTAGGAVLAVLPVTALAQPTVSVEFRDGQVEAIASPRPDDGRVPQPATRTPQTRRR